jgi:splicing factor 3A subunit 1
VEPVKKFDLAVKLIDKVLQPPDVEQYTIRLPEGITGEELDTSFFSYFAIN